MERAWVSGAGLLAAAIVLTVLPVQAAKPPPPSAETGTIYYMCWASTTGTTLCSMKPDGSNPTTLISSGDWEPAEWTFEPSWGVHGGDRWFLVRQPVRDGAGDFETWPDGTVREEIFALTASGESVRLTDGHLYNGVGAVVGWIAPENAPADDACHNARWARSGSTEDGLVSYLGQEYDGQGAPVEGASGLYVVTFDPSDLPGATALDLTPSLVDLPVPTGGTQFPTNWGYDWSPEGTAIVFYRFNDPDTSVDESGLWRADFAGGSWVLGSTALHASAIWPRWSRTADPADQRILFKAHDSTGAICSMKPDGTDVKEIVPAPASTKRLTKRVNRPHWSPQATQLVYEFQASSSTTATYDVYRVDSGGSGATNLTGSLSGQAHAIGWRP